MKNKKWFTRMLAYLLIVALLGTNCVFAAVSSKEQYRQTYTYWIKNPEHLKEYFNVESHDGEHYLIADKLILNLDTMGESEIPAEYQILIGDNEIILNGVLTPEIISKSIYLIGHLSNEVCLNGKYFTIDCAINAKQDSDFLNVGLSISPINATSLDEMVFMGVGDPLTLGETIRDEIKQKFDTIKITDNSSNLRDDNGSGYTYKGQKNIVSTQVSGYAECFQIWYNQNWERVCIGAYTNAQGVESYFSAANDLPFAYVNTLKIGLKPTAEGPHYVSGLYDYPTNLSYQSNSSLFDADFINSILNVVAASLKPGMAPAAISAFSALLNTCKNKANAGTSWSAVQSNTYVYFNFAQTFANHSDIDFYDAPLTVKFGIASSQTGTYSFTGYSSMSYYVQIAHLQSYDYTTLYVNIPQGSKTISSFYINNND